MSQLKLPSGLWDKMKLQQLFDARAFRNIYCMHWVDQQAEDKLVWVPNRTGKFSVNSAYRLATNVSAGDSQLDV